MSKLLALLPLNAWLIVIGVVLAAVGGLYALQSVRLGAAQKDLADTKVLLAQARQLLAERDSTVAKMTKAAGDTARETEEMMAQAEREKTDALNKERAKSATALAAARVADRSLRDYIATFAPTGSRTGEAPTSSNPGLEPADRAAALGNVLATCRAESTEDAGDLEDLATRVRGLQGHIQVIESGQSEYWRARTDAP